MATLNLTVGGANATSDEAFQLGADIATDIATDVGVVDFTNEWGGVRFINVTVPQAAIITAATLSLNILSSLADEPDHTFYGVLAANTGTFTTATNDLPGRTRTTASVAWDSTDLGAAGDDYHSPPDLSTIIQEIVNQGSWASGNALAIVWTSTNGLTARDLGTQTYKSSPTGTKMAKLDITYTEPAASGGQQGGRMNIFGGR